MRKILRVLCLTFLCAALLCVHPIPALAAEEPTVQPLTILFTHDTHDHWYPEPT